MKKILLSRIMVIIACLTLSISQGKADEYFVSPTGNGTGTENSPASLTSLASYLSTLRLSYLEDEESELSVYFMGGTYTAPTSAMQVGHGTASNVSGLTINFLPYSDEEVIIQRTSSSAVNFANLSSGNSSGDLTLNVSGIIFQGFTITGSNRIFGYSNYTALSFNDVIFRNNTLTSGYLIYGTSNNYNLSFTNVSFQNNTASSLIYVGGTAGSDEVAVNIRNCHFEGNSTSGNGMIYFVGSGSNGDVTPEIQSCVFTNNRVNSSSANYALIYAHRFNLNVNNSTFYSNNFNSTSNNCISIYYSSSTYDCLIYNNTFSDNPVNNGLFFNVSRNGGVFNNTFYQSGGISLGGAVSVRNNLIVGNYGISGTTSGVARNIFSNSYFASGTSNGTTIQNLASYIEPLTTYENTLTPVHPLVINTNGTHPILERGGKVTDLGDYASLVTADQRGRARPENISLGAWDLPIFGVMDGRYTILYDPDAGFDPYYDLDLGDYILSLPEGATLDNITYRVLTQPTNGEINPENARRVRFYPKTEEDGSPASGIIGGSSDFTCQVYYNLEGSVYQANVKIRIFINNIKQPLGIIDNMVVKCYREMGEIDFASRYKFVSSAINNNFPPGINSFPNATASNTNNNFKYNGFSISLVGDLDGDGKPEIVAIGMARGRTGLSQYGDYLCILNGQTGKEIVRYQFPFTGWNLRPSGHHSSPASIALVDADRNGRAEIIVAVGNAGNSNYNYRLLCYEVNENTFLDRDGGSDAGNQNKLTLKWKSSSYLTPTANWATKAIPQVVDIDGDGVPEILACHKVYNALTGEELLTLDPNYMGLDPNSHVGDQYIPFAYIYDVDMDGKYDIAAGGKLYYDIDIHKKGAAPYYKTKVMNGIGDGHTAVADINGDGIPDIIVSRNRTTSYHNLFVWDPGFFEKDASGNLIRVDKSPQIIASREAYQSNHGTGSHSYIYVGDIDGRIDSKGKKLPEISILGGSWFSNNTRVPVHPNVAGLNGGNPFNTNNNGYLTYGGSNSQNGYGAIISYTWDETANSVADRLKVSFVLKHNDSSINTGFTLFDFNNNGVQQICYRDEYRLRIISANDPYYDAYYEGDMSTSVLSYTGFEYPVIADIDGDGSADMIVMGQNYNRTTAYGFVYSVESQNGDFAPAPKVWNQFMYHPMKINEDLTTPLVNFHPLDESMAYIKEKDAETGDKTYIYNNTITQAIISAEFNGILKPIVKTPDAKIEGYVDTGNSQIVLSITNHGDATLNAQTPIRFYRETLAASSLISTLNGSAIPAVIGTDIFVGDTLVITQRLSNSELYDNYIIRVTDGSTSSNFFEDISKQSNYYDCNWADNMIEVGTFVARNDAATVSQYGEVIIDILANDVLPDGFDGQLRDNMIVEYPAVGSWSIVNNKLKYVAPASAGGEVIRFKYQLTHDSKVKTAEVYVCILESCSYGFSVCAGSTYQACLKEIPAGIRFEWYDETQTTYLGEEAPVLTNMQSDRTFYVKPIFEDVTDSQYSGHRAMDFPMGQLVISVIPSGSGTVTAKWKGLIDTNWYNPANWVQLLDNGTEVPVSWTPNNCTHVILASNASYYPILTNPAECVDITVEDRAMLAGVHHLTYVNAAVELNLGSTERERYVMLSAPLKDVYSGDYHFKKDGKPNWGDVYMTYFQAGNPDFPTSVAQANAFTASFGNVFETLPLGKAFNLNVINRSTDAAFRFPLSETSYTDEKGTTQTVNRSATSKFITDGALQADGTLTLPVFNDHENSQLLQIVNPFAAYLDANAFLLANSDQLERHYKVWDGKIENGFVTIQVDSVAGDHASARYIIDDPDAIDWENTGFIPPFQSFLVMKKADVINKVTNVRMSSAMTTTLGGTYALRSGNTTQNTLWIKAQNGDGSNSTALYYSPEAVQSYVPGEDARKLFNEESPVSVYTLSPAQDALTINASGDFSQDVFVGLRLKSGGNLTLSFEGLESFQHEVYLIDHEDNEKVYDLASQKELTFTIDGYSTGKFVELNNRFSLHMEYVPTGVPDITANGLNVYSRKGTLFVTGQGGEEIRNLQIYNVRGQLVYSSAKRAGEFKVSLPSNQVYIVKGEIGGTIHIKKSIVQ